MGPNKQTANGIWKTKTKRIEKPQRYIWCWIFTSGQSFLFLFILLVYLMMWLKVLQQSHIYMQSMKNHICMQLFVYITWQKQKHNKKICCDLCNGQYVWIVWIQQYHNNWWRRCKLYAHFFVFFSEEILFEKFILVIYRSAFLPQ